jgi:Uma2 family endonuclease
MVALRKPTAMTTAEFQAWEPEEFPDRRWQLLDGEPACMAPASENHGRILAELTRLLGNHLAQHRPDCGVVVAPGIIPRSRPDINHRIPDLGVTCAAPGRGQTVADPVLLVEILSPSNARISRQNVWAYLTIPSVTEILLLGSQRVEAELLRRGTDGDWPEGPEFLAPEDLLDLPSIGLRLPLRDLYRTTTLP